jgi:ATP-dependent Clp protease protease subunit
MKNIKPFPIGGIAIAFAPIVRQSKRPQEAVDALKQMGVQDISLENRLEVHAKGDEHEIVLIGAVGGSWWDESGITEKEFRDALKAIPNGKPITVTVNSEGGSVKEGLGIYNAIKSRNGDIRVRIEGYALSIASVFPLAAKKSLGGRGVISPKAAIWMQHKAWSWAAGNADEMRKQADCLDAHDETLIDIYAAATGKPKDEIRSIMEKETWTKGSDAVAAGLADETDEDNAQASYRPLRPDFVSRCKNLSPEILNCISAKTGRAAGNNNQPTNQEHTMNKSVIVALLTTHGIVNSTTKKPFTVEDSDADIEAGLKALAAKPGLDSVARMEAIEAKLEMAETRRITDKISTFVDAQKITKAEVPIFVAASRADEAGTIAILEAKETQGIGGESAGAHVITIEYGPTLSANGVQGSKILPELENIFASTKTIAVAANDEHKTPLQAMARYDALKREFPRLLKAAFAKDRGQVNAGNTFSATITTNFLILGVIVKLYNRFAAANLFTLDAEQDPYKPLAPGIRKFNTTTTDGTKVGKNVTNFQTLAGGTAGNPDSVIDPITITPDQYTAAGYITNAQLNSGFRIADIIEAKLIDLADKITQVFTAPITVANFVTNAPVISAPAAFGFSDLATLQGILKKTTVKNLLLDGEYIARVANQPGFFQMAGTVGGSAAAWRAYGWDNVALNTEWAGAGANVRGFGCGKNAIGIISGLPLNPPEGIPGNIVQTGVAQLPDVQKAIATYVWFDPSTRTLYFSFDMIAGATLIDETQGVLVKSQ